MATITEDRYADTKSWFNSLFGMMESAMNGMKDRSSHTFRRHAIQSLEKVAFPNRRDEDWKYTGVRPILQPRYQIPQWVKLNEKQIAPYLYEGLETHLLVFVNGVYDQTLSSVKELPQGVAILPLDEAIERKAYRSLVEKHWVDLPEHEDNPFALLNTAFAQHGVFIHIPANTVLEKPIHLLNLTVSDNDDPQLISPLTIAIAEKNSEATLLESFHELPGTGGTAYFNNLVNRFVVGENATLRHFKVQRESPDSFVVNNTTIDQHRASTFSSFVADLGGKIVRNNISAWLKDEGTQTNFYGIFLGDGGQHIDNQTFIDHAHPHCQSNELYKGILTDTARGVFNGKVMVRQDAQKTNAFQQNATLVLSDKARMDAKPQLEIYADDVRCSHGATIGQLDEDAVFYMKSRGLSDSQARSLLQHAFIREVIEFLPSDIVRDQMDQWVVEKFATQWI